MKKLFVILLIVSILAVILSGCYKVSDSSDGLAVVNTFTGDVFFPETREFVEYPDRSDREGGYDYYDSRYSFNSDFTTPSGFDIHAEVRIDYDIVFYSVSVRPSEAHISDVMAERNNGGTLVTRDEVAEDIVSDLRGKMETVTISLRDYAGFELASGAAYTNSATGILNSDNVVDSFEMHGSFEINPRFVEDVYYITTPFTF